jgi:acyl-CoA reductase-like NAD-dependent aldehyde dehydrogenase
MFTDKAANPMVVPCVINGKATSLPQEQTFAVVSSTTGETAHLAQSATADLAVSAVEAAAQAFKSWKKVSVLQRRDILNRAADILQAKAEEATKRATLETSCDENWPRFDCSLAATAIRQNAATALTLCGKLPPSDDGINISLVFKEPVGVVMVIPP